MNELIIETLIARWIRHLEHSRSSDTVQNYRSTIGRWKCMAPAYFNDLTHQDIRRWLDKLIDAGCHPNSVRTYYYSVRSFCEWVSERYEIANPTLQIRIKQFPQGVIHRRVISRKEYQLLLDFTKGTLRDLILFLGNTGVRSHELRTILWQDVHTDYIQILGKGNKPRLIDLNKTLQTMLSQYPRCSDRQLQFVLKHARNSSKIRWTFQRLARRLKMEPFGPHALRHYYATELMRRGIPLKKISMALGHASTAITETVYVHASFGDIKGINSCLDE